MTKSIFATSLSRGCKLRSRPKSHPDNPLSLDARLEDDELKELAVEEDCYCEHGNAGALSASRHECISLFRDKYDSDVRNEYDDIKSLSSEACSEEERSGCLEGSKTVARMSGTVNCLEDKSLPVYVSPLCLEEETGFSGTNSRFKEETVLFGDSYCSKKNTGLAGVNPCWDEGTSVSGIRPDKIKEGEEYGYCKAKRFTFEGESLNSKEDANNTYILHGVNSSNVPDGHSTAARLQTEKYGNASINSADIQYAVNQIVRKKRRGHPGERCC